MFPSRETRKILCVGLLNLDIISTIEYFPLEDTGQRYLNLVQLLIIHSGHSDSMHNNEAAAPGRLYTLLLHCLVFNNLDSVFPSVICHTHVYVENVPC